VTNLYGNSGKDIIRSDYWRTYGIGTEENDGGNEYLFGDFKYGEDALDKDLWGDDDLMYGGYGAGTATQNMYGGDGADYIVSGHNWTNTKVEGGNGDDTYKAPQMISASNNFRGGDGDDTVLVEAYGDVATGEENVFDIAMGQAGNDVIRGTHKAGAQYLYGGDGEDKLYGGDGQTDAAKFQVMSGNAGDDWLEGGDGFTGEQHIYGDTQRIDTFALNEYDEENADKKDSGDDVLYGGNNGLERQWLVGGYGDDRIFSGSGASGTDSRIRIFGDLRGNTNVENSARTGAPEDGDDFIDIGDNPDIAGPGTDIKAFGQGGNDKILGSLGILEELYGGDGDDKIWAENPGQVETVPDVNTIFGGNGKDIIYGSVMRDRLYGDWQREYDDETILNDSTGAGKYDLLGDDDIIYTGVSTGTYEQGGDYVHGGWGDDKIYGQGVSGHWLNGEFGDDMIWGSDGNDYIYGDDYNVNSSGQIYENDTPGALRWTFVDGGVMSGDDTLYGGKGADLVHGGAGDDYLYGEDDQDKLYGDGGEDVLFGGDGADYIYTGTGWDTVFGGDGCDYIYS